MKALPMAWSKPLNDLGWYYKLLDKSVSNRVCRYFQGRGEGLILVWTVAVSSGNHRRFLRMP
jgi:hypothetical protein